MLMVTELWGSLRSPFNNKLPISSTGTSTRLGTADEVIKMVQYVFCLLFIIYSSLFIRPIRATGTRQSHVTNHPRNWQPKSTILITLPILSKAPIAPSDSTLRSHHFYLLRQTASVSQVSLAAFKESLATRYQHEKIERHR